METITVSHGDCEYRVVGSKIDNEWHVFRAFERDEQGECWLVNFDGLSMSVLSQLFDELVSDRWDGGTTPTSIVFEKVRGTPLLVACDGCEWSHAIYETDAERVDMHDRHHPTPCAHCEGEITIATPEAI
jgi:hypothetical protein